VSQHLEVPSHIQSTTTTVQNLFCNCVNLFCLLSFLENVMKQGWF
jgi:hypothetical protein